MLSIEQNQTSRILIAGAAAVVLFASGCASVAVTNDSLEQRTAAALGVEKGAFTISDRLDDGIKTTYSVKTARGQQYNCYVTGTLSVTGRTVSDALCNKKGEQAKNPLLAK